MSTRRTEPTSNVDPSLPYWIRQSAEFAGALGRTARSKRPIAVVAWVLIAIVALSLVGGWLVQLIR